MKCFLPFAALVFFSLPSFAQKKPVVEIEKMVTRQDVEAPLTFLAADQMRGRDTGSPELDIAANYLSAHFQQNGLQPLPGSTGYFQPVTLQKVFPLAAAELRFKDDVFKFKENIVVLEGDAIEWTGEFLYVGYGTPEELPQDIKGKMIVSLAGDKDSSNPRKIYSASGEKFERIKAAGGVGLIEVIVSPTFPWPAVVNRFTNRSTMGLKTDEAEAMPLIWMKDATVAGMEELKAMRKVNGSLSIGARKTMPFSSKNVVAKVEGTDPVLKNEHIIISAHYDHVGVGAKKDQDSIYNGARDNALGTVGLMTAARFFAKYPPKRSIIFMALTAEEKGLLGSEWYVEHPLLPLQQMVFNMDCDGAGYNDKTVATVIGLERTTAEANITKACEAFGLKAVKDPVPEQNLYERGDNFNFAKKGIPSVDFATGFKSFDEEIIKYYHQPADETSSLDFDYLVKYYKAFLYANYLVANGPATPFWNAGDKYEAAGKALYRKP
jgi:hypothetical protein